VLPEPDVPPVLAPVVEPPPEVGRLVPTPGFCFGFGFGLGFGLGVGVGVGGMLAEATGAGEGATDGG
jgi:hypothetical protein